jgi:hypothetical protein
MDATLHAGLKHPEIRPHVRPGKILKWPPKFQNGRQWAELKACE